jgi:hypothetical protein
MLQYMQKQFEEREILSFDAKDRRIMCFPHTINIAVQHILSKMSSVKAPDDDDEDPEDLIGAAGTDEVHGFGQSFEEARAQDPIACLRRIVMAI